MRENERTNEICRRRWWREERGERDAEKIIRKGVELYAEKLICLFSRFCYSWNHLLCLHQSLCKLRMHGRTADILRQSLAVPLLPVSKASGSRRNPIASPAGGSWIVHHGRERILIRGVPLRFLNAWNCVSEWSGLQKSLGSAVPPAHGMIFRQFALIY